MSTAKIIYIIGAGRSGTTLLDILLGNQDVVFSAGELNRFLKRDGVPHSARDKEALQFWENVSREIECDFASLKSSAHKLEYHTGWFKQVFLNNKEIFKYEDFNRKLFKAISRQLKADKIIVDSSKYPMRAKHLSRIFKDRVSFIYVQRNPLDVVTSFGKKDVEQPSKGRIAANVYLFAVNVLAKIIFNRLKRTHSCSVVSYDELVTEPKQVFRKLSSDLNIDFFQVQQKFDKNEKFQVGWLFDGNRLRLKNEIALKLKRNDKKGTGSVLNSILLRVHSFFWFKY